MTRILQTELLDTLPASDPAAIASRRDIRRLNSLMDHRALLCRALTSTVVRPPSRIIELGAGDGSLSLALAAHFAPRWPGVELLLVDLQKVVPDATLDEIRRLGWKAEPIVADALQWLGTDGPPAGLIFANLFLHHFTGEQLGGLFQQIAAHTQTFVALEPRRAAWPLFCCRWLGLIGCNAVTRHDAPASVRAGFRDRELSTLWGASWRLDERRAGLFSHQFIASREIV